MVREQPTDEDLAQEARLGDERAFAYQPRAPRPGSAEPVSRSPGAIATLSTFHTRNFV